jgi:Helix-turn-helix domain
MSVSAIGWAIEQQVSDPSVKLTLILLANCMNAETGKCCPSLKYLAAKCGQSERTVQRNLQRLEDGGLIERTPSFDKKGRQTSNAYKIADGGQKADTDVVGRASRASGEGDTRVRGEGDAGVSPIRGTGSKEPEKEPEGGNKGERPPESPADISILPRVLEQSESPAAPQSPVGHESYKIAADQPQRPDKGRSSRAPTKLPIPADLDLSEEMLTFAEERGWDRARSAGEFEHFKAYYTADGRLSADWSATWKNWVLRGLRFDDDQRQKARSGRATGPTTMVDTLLAHAVGVARQGYVQ